MILALQYSPALLPAIMNLSGWGRTLVQQTFIERYMAAFDWHAPFDHKTFCSTSIAWPSASRTIKLRVCL